MSKTHETPPINTTHSEEELVATLPLNAVENIPLHAHSLVLGVQDPANFSAAAIGRSDFLTCAKRSHFGDTMVVRVVPTPLPA